ncbi:MAG: hypothetical protein GVY28_01210 [Alphaproteobacteria bacterium]|jgi:hypothetical protein|nr:hypothetical protein [Alphaproteobacteria bacterium]
MPDLDVDKLVLIVVGAHLSAEVSDRPLAYRLQESMRDRLHQLTGSTEWPVTPLTCTDVWYLNHDELQRQPVVAIGGPGVNALSAYLYQKLPTALAIEDQLVIQLDVEMAELRCAVWGFDGRHTASALELFENKYLGEWLRAAAGLA